MKHTEEHKTNTTSVSTIYIFCIKTKKQVENMPTVVPLQVGAELPQVHVVLTPFSSTGIQKKLMERLQLESSGLAIWCDHGNNLKVVTQALKC